MLSDWHPSSIRLGLPPQTNGAVERANTLIFTSIKKYLEDQKKRKWIEELLKVVRSHNTLVSRATNFTPFKFLFTEEVVTPEEIKLKKCKNNAGGYA
jgi:hypothetical protein